MAGRSNRNYFQGGGASGLTLVSPDGSFFPFGDESPSVASQINLTVIAANMGYAIFVHRSFAITFGHATARQGVGTSAGINVYFGVYQGPTTNAIKIFQSKHTTLGAPGNLPGTLLPAAPIAIPSGGLWVVFAADAVAGVATTIDGMPMTVELQSFRNAQGFAGNLTKGGILAGGLLPTSTDFTTWTKITTGHGGSNGSGVILLES